MTDVKKLYANVSFEIDPEENERLFLERQELAFKYFYHFNKSSKILNDPKALNALQYTHSNFSKWFKHIHQQIELSLKYDFSKIVLNIIENCYQRIIECIHFIKQVNEINEKNRIGSMAICLMALEILDMCTSHSKKFSIKFHLDNYPGSFKTILNFITNRKIQENWSMLEQYQADSQEFVLMSGIFKSLLSSIANLTRHANSSCQKIWLELNSIEIFENFSDKMKSIIFVPAYVNLTKAYLLDANLTDHVVRYLIDLFRLILHQKTRIGMIIESSQKRRHKIAYINLSGQIFNLIDLIKVFHKISSIDEFKFKIYFEFKLKKYLIKAVYNSTEFELKYCLNLLWNLCYNSQIAGDVKQNELLMKFILKLSQANDKKIVQNISKGILKLLDYRSVENLEQIINNENEIKFYNITILNQSDNLDLCLLIKNELEKNEYRTTLYSNYDEDFNASLVQMKKSFCVLICLDEYFELNFNNTGFRAQCEHAIKFSKPIIPIIMQKTNILFEINKFLWLDEILRKNVPFYIYKSSFHLCFNGLNDHILLLKDRSINKTRKIFDWNEQAVDNWLKSKCLNQAIIDNIAPCSGRILYELYLISLNAPNFFYQQLSNDQEDGEINSDTNLFITVNEFALFKAYLKELFE